MCSQTASVVKQCSQVFYANSEFSQPSTKSQLAAELQANRRTVLKSCPPSRFIPTPPIIGAQCHMKVCTINLMDAGFTMCAHAVDAPSLVSLLYQMLN